MFRTFALPFGHGRIRSFKYFSISKFSQIPLRDESDSKKKKKIKNRTYR